MRCIEKDNLEDIKLVKIEREKQAKKSNKRKKQESDDNCGTRFKCEGIIIFEIKEESKKVLLDLMKLFSQQSLRILATHQQPPSWP